MKPILHHPVSPVKLSMWLYDLTPASPRDLVERIRYPCAAAHPIVGVVGRVAERVGHGGGKVTDSRSFGRFAERGAARRESGAKQGALEQEPTHSGSRE